MARRITRRAWLAVAVSIAALAGTAHATYSIVAVDAARRQVGGAGTSCVGSLSVRVIYGSVPGKGAVHAQARLGGQGREEAVTQLGLDVAPADIITAITMAQFDSQAQQRQYGIVDLLGRSAGFTGTQTGAFAADRQATLGAYTFSVQGNILTSVAVIDQATAAFEAGGCDLADRLMRSLEAGARNGEGDSRCTGDGIPADSAFLQVDREGEAAGTYLQIEVTDTAPEDPLVLLRAQYDAWRATHPCPAAPPADAGVDGDAGDDPGGADDPAGCCSGSRGAETGASMILVALLLGCRGRSESRRRRPGALLRVTGSEPTS